MASSRKKTASQEGAKDQALLVRKNKSLDLVAKKQSSTNVLSKSKDQHGQIQLTSPNNYGNKMIGEGVSRQ